MIEVTEAHDTEAHYIEVTKDMFFDMEPDELGRDIFSAEVRYREWMATEAIHHFARKAEIYKRDLSHEFQIWSGIPGSGKTSSMVTYARRLYRLGWDVASVKGGIMFGVNISTEAAYYFSDSLEPGTVLLIPEIHTLMGRFNDQSQRQQAFMEATTAVRKEGLKILGDSAGEDLISPAAKLAADCLVYPEQKPPLRVVKGERQRGGHRWPDFCYIQENRLVNPFPSKFRGADPEYGLVPAKQTYVHRKRLIPGEVYDACKLYDTFQRVPILQGANIDAQALRDGHNALMDGKAPAGDGGPVIDMQALFEALVDDGLFDSRIDALIATNQDKLARGKKVVNPKASPQEIAALMSAKAAVRISTADVTGWLRRRHSGAIDTQGVIKLHLLLDEIDWWAD